MKAEWLKYCEELSGTKADMYSGCRKIIRGRILEFNTIDDDLLIGDAGFTKSKISMLNRNYNHVESREVAQQLWRDRVAKNKYGSIGFTCYNHLIKGADGQRSHWESVNSKRAEIKGTSKRASVMGPCIQAVNLTYLKKGKIALDMFYRTTEFYKKFPADLVFLRDVLLDGFDLRFDDITSVRAHFANITIHPMYFVTIMPLLNNPLYTLKWIGRHDKYFHDWIVKWTARYVCPEYHRGIAKFAQALRVQKHALESINSKDLKAIQQYLRDNHPGHRGEYEEDEDGD